MLIFIKTKNELHKTVNIGIAAELQNCKNLTTF